MERVPTTSASGFPDGVEDRQLGDTDALGQRQRRTDQGAVGIDAAEDW